MATVTDQMVWEPRDEGDLLRRCMNDPRYFLETFCAIRGESGVLLPFHFNQAQAIHHLNAYREVAPNVWVRVVFDEIHGKGRQFGDSTLQIGYIYHQWAWGVDFGPAFVGKILAFADRTARELQDIALVMHETALENLASALNCDPYDYLPRGDIKNAHVLGDSYRGCKMIFASEKTKGQGRATTANWLYITDLSEWTTYADAIAGYAGSLSKSGREVVVRDFTGKGAGNAAHIEWQRLTESHAQQPDGPARAFFYGTREIGYDPAFLERQRQLIADDVRFRREYPERWQDMFTASPNARFKPDLLEVARGRGDYLINEIPDLAELAAKTCPVYGLDTAEGTPDGDYAVIKCRDANTLREIREPWRERASPNEQIAAMARMHAELPGLIVVARINHGHAVILGLVALGLEPWLYVHDSLSMSPDDKLGFPESSVSRPLLHSLYETALERTTFNLPSANEHHEAGIFGLQKNGRVDHPPGFHDDELVASMLCVAGSVQAVRRLEGLRGGGDMYLEIGSMMERGYKP